MKTVTKLRRLEEEIPNMKGKSEKKPWKRTESFYGI